MAARKCLLSGLSLRLYSVLNGRLNHLRMVSTVLLGQIAWTRITFTSHRYTGAFTAYSVVVGAIPIISFACLTLHVWTNAPPFRRFLIRLNTSRDKATRGLDRSVIFINTSLFLFCGFAGGLLALPGGQAYHQGDTAGRVYAEAIKILDDAKVTQDVAALMNLTPIMAKFGECHQAPPPLEFRTEHRLVCLFHSLVKHLWKCHDTTPTTYLATCSALSFSSTCSVPSFQLFYLTYISEIALKTMI